MNKKLYTGAYLLQMRDEKTQFGSVDASYSTTDKSEKVKLTLRVDDLQLLEVQDGFVNLQMSVEQLEVIAEKAFLVTRNIELLKILDKRGKLNDNAYLIDEKTDM